MFPIRNDLKQDAFLLLFFNCDLEYAIRMFQVNQDAWNWIVHISFWFMLMMLMYWVAA